MTSRGQGEPLGIRAVTFKNASSETIPAFGVIRITDTAKQTNGVYVLKGEKSNTWGSQYRHFINGAEDVSAGDFGVCYVPTSPVWVKYSTSATPAVGETWGPKNDTWDIYQHVGGFEIVSSETESGRVLVVQKPMLWFLGKTDASHSKGATGTVSIYTGSLGSETDTTVNKTGVYNRFADLASGKWVHCKWIKDDEFEFDAGEC